MLPIVSVSTGAGGVRRCSRCHSVEPATYRAASAILEEIAGIVAAWPGGPGPNVALAGAEPFGHPELPAIVTGAVGAGIVSLGLETDGVALAMGENAAGALNAGVRHVRIRLTAGPAELDGRPSRDAVRAGVEAFAAAASSAGAAVALTAVIEVCPHAASDVPSAVAFAGGIGASAVTLDVDGPAVSDPAALAWVMAACDTGVVNGVWVEVSGVPPCMMGEHILHCAAVVREYAGAKGPGCAVCAVSPTCSGLAVDAPGQAFAALVAPADQETLASRIARARGGGDA